MTDISNVLVFETTDESGSHADFTADLTGTPLEVNDNKRYEVALLNGYLKLDTPNISTALNNNSFTITTPTPATITATIEDGRYSVFELNTFFDRYSLTDLGLTNSFIEFQGSTATGVLSFALTSGYTITFSQGLADILGMTTATYSSAINTGTSQPKLDQGILYINATCDAIERNMVPKNSASFLPEGILKTFQYTGISSSTLNFHSEFLVWRPLKEYSGHVHSMRFRLIDQDGNLLPLKSSVHYIIAVKEIE
jgi:hypothetical protein